VTEHYVSAAVAALGDYYEANLEDQLALVEAASGLEEGALELPDAYVKGFVPSDTRSPLLMVFDDGMRAVDQGSGIYAVSCGAAIVFNGDADVAAGQEKIRRYLTAVVWTVAKNPTLSGAVINCAFVRASREGVIDAPAETRHAYFVDWEVLVDDPVAI